MKLVDKMKKLQGSLIIGKNKELDNVAEGHVETHKVEDEDTGRVVASFTTKGDKILNSFASQDAQESGAYEKASKKAGFKENDIVYTTTQMASAQSSVAEDKDKRSEDHEAEKAKLVKADDLEKGLKGDWKKEGYKLKVTHHERPSTRPEMQSLAIKAYDKKGKAVGHLYTDAYDFDEGTVNNDVHVDGEHRRKGLASAMYSHAEKVLGKKIAREEEEQFHSSDAKALWHQPNRPFGKSDELEKGLKGDWKKEGYSISPGETKFHPSTNQYTLQMNAHSKDGKRVGGAQFVWHKDDSEIYPAVVSVSFNHERKGIASSIYKLAEEHTGKKIKYNPRYQTSDAQAMWANPNREFAKSDDVKFPKSIEALHLDKELDTPEISKKHADLHMKLALQSKDPQSRMYHHDQHARIMNHIRGTSKHSPKVHNMDKSVTNDDAPKPTTPKQNTLDYSKINAIKEQAPGPTIDYSKLKDNKKTPRWKKPDFEAKKNKNQESKVARVNNPALDPVKKSDPLQKDVTDLKTGKRIGKPDEKKVEPQAQKTENRPGALGLFDILGRKNKAPDTRSSDEKIKDALASQSDTNPYASRRDQRDFAVPSKPAEPEAKPLASEVAQDRWGSGRKLTERNRAAQDDRPFHERSHEEKVQHLMGREDDPKVADFIKEINTRGHDEPYYGSPIDNVAWRSKKYHPTAKNSIPVFRVPDLKGYLGKDVAKGGNDPFAWQDAKWGATKKALQEHAGKPLTISTRSDLISHDDYIQHLDKKNHKIKMHMFDDAHKDDRKDIGSFFDKAQRRLEPGAPSSQRRLEAAKKLKDHGFDVTLVHDKIEGLPESQKFDHLGLQKQGFKTEVNSIKPGLREKMKIEKALGKKLIKPEQSVQAQGTKPSLDQVIATEEKKKSVKLPKTSKELFEMDKKVRAETEPKKPSLSPVLGGKK